MKIGKREQIVGISVAALATIALVHVMIFNPRTRDYREMQQKFEADKTLVEQQARPSSPNQIKNFIGQTATISDRVTSVVDELRLDIPQYYGSRRDAAVQRRVQDCVDLMKRLMAVKAELSQGNAQPRLTFLDDVRVDPNNQFSPQLGWNIPVQLPEQRQGALWDNVSKLQDRWVLLNAIAQPYERLQQRRDYNQLLTFIGVNAAEVSDYVAPVQVNYAYDYVFFNGFEQAETLLTSRLLPNITTLEQLKNPLSTNRFGPAVPTLKKLWVSELIYERKDPNTVMEKPRLRDVLEVNLPTDHSLLVINKQLEALVDIIGKARENGVTEIQRVNLLRGLALIKFEGRNLESTATVATPTPTPITAATMDEAMMMGMPGMMPGMYPGMGMAQTPIPEEQKVGGGTGLEMWFVANNANLVQFLFAISNAPRSYAIDDMDVQVQADRTLLTSCTIELVTNIE